MMKSMKHLVGWLLVVVQFALMAALFLLPRREASSESAMIGGALIVLSVLLGVLAFRSLGTALTPTPVPMKGAGLRTSGIYRSMRHPIYLSVLLFVFGYVIAVGSWGAVGVAASLVLFFVLKSRWEDQLLAAAHPGAWETWAQKTGAFGPAMRRHR
jgi:protein-S-isoprenylcysteine O-methyltransferase Ste14